MKGQIIGLVLAAGLVLAGANGDKIKAGLSDVADTFSTSCEGDDQTENSRMDRQAAGPRVTDNRKEVRTDIQTEGCSDTPKENQRQTQSETQTDAQQDDQTETQSEVQTDAQPGSQTEAQSEAKPDSQTEETSSFDTVQDDSMKGHAYIVTASSLNMRTEPNTDSDGNIVFKGPRYTIYYSTGNFTPDHAWAEVKYFTPGYTPCADTLEHTGWVCSKYMLSVKEDDFWNKLYSQLGVDPNDPQQFFDTEISVFSSLGQYQDCSEQLQSIQNDIDEYNAKVDDYNSQVDAYNRKLDEMKHQAEEEAEQAAAQQEEDTGAGEDNAGTDEAVSDSRSSDAADPDAAGQDTASTDASGQAASDTDDYSDAYDNSASQRTVCPICNGTGQMYIPNLYYDVYMGWYGGYTCCSGCGGSGYIV